MNQPVIGYAGLTHLGLNSAVASASKGFSVIGFHDDYSFVEQLSAGKPHIAEPDLEELLVRNLSQLVFSADATILSTCDIVYISVDVPTDNHGGSDLSSIYDIITTVTEVLRKDALLVILCQVPPGFTRRLNWPASQLYYQVETLIFGRAIERACFPERFILGCAIPTASIDGRLMEYLSSFGCPIFPMLYESAELAKISINMFLIASISASNTLAEICESIGAEWNEIVPALRLDKRIGNYAYLSPGLGISGGNLERDMTTVINLSEKYDTDSSVVSSWFNNSKHRKNWPWKKLNELVLSKIRNPVIGLLGLSYKENTHSLKNSPAIVLLERLGGLTVNSYDPAANQADIIKSNSVRKETANEVIAGADVLLILTPWPEFRSIKISTIKEIMRGRVIIDPYQILDGDKLVNNGFTYVSLGKPASISN